jgi:hypothetical protein
MGDTLDGSDIFDIVTYILQKTVLQLIEWKCETECTPIYAWKFRYWMSIILSVIEITVIVETDDGPDAETNNMTNTNEKLWNACVATYVIGIYVGISFCCCFSCGCCNIWCRLGMFHVMELIIMALEIIVFIFSISYGKEQGDDILNASTFWNFVRSCIVFISGIMMIYDIGLFVYNIARPKNLRKALDNSECCCNNRIYSE